MEVALHCSSGDYELEVPKMEVALHCSSGDYELEVASRLLEVW